MLATCEISMYPLKDDYEPVIIDFILRLKKNPKLTIEVNGLSTQVFGEFDVLTSAINAEMKISLETNKIMFVMKLGKGELKKEKIADVLK